MASTITRHGSGGAFSRPMANTNRTLKMIGFDLAVTNYTTAGEDVSSVANEFATVLGCLISPDSATPTVLAQYNISTKKVLLFTGDSNATYAVSALFDEKPAGAYTQTFRCLMIGY